MMRLYKSSAAAKIIAYGLLILFVFSPLVIILVKSFENPVRTEVLNIAGFIDNHFSLEQYKNVLFHNLSFWKAWWNTLILVVPTLLLSIGIAALAAYGMVILKPKLRKWVYGIYVLLSMLPLQMLLVPNYIMMDRLDLIGTRLSVILIAVFSPYYIVFIYRSICQIKMETIEAARMEGAGELRIFLSIVMPQIKLGISTFSLICAIELWSMIEQPLVFMRDETQYPLSILFQNMDPGSRYAGAVVYALPMILLFLCMEKDLADGISNFMGGKK